MSNSSATAPTSGNRRRLKPLTWQFNGRYSGQDGKYATKRAQRANALERARIFRRLRLSLRDLFFFHFSLILIYGTSEGSRKKQ
jgi:hypothetical protein